MFRPPTHQEGDRIVMPVTFPDGSTAELVYAPELGLESALVVPNWSATVRIGEDGASSDFAVRYGSLRESVAPFATLTSTERGAHGSTVCIYDFDPPLDREYLVYRFGRWIVGVHSAEDMTPEVRRAWAAGLTGSASPDGFLILDTTGAVKFTPPGRLHGPEITFQQNYAIIRLRLRACAPDEQTHQTGGLPGYGSRCVADTGVRINVSGHPRPADEVLLGLDVRKVVNANR